MAEKEYRQFVRQGIGRSIWQDVRGQAILGEDAFADELVDRIRDRKDIPEIPRSQRYAHRPELDRIFSPAVLKDRRKRNGAILEAIERYGYTQRAIADHLGMHFTYISQIVRGI